jgi:hypothetical protein
MAVPNVQNVVNEANKIMKMQIAPFIKDEVERQIKEKIKPECLK